MIPAPQVMECSLETATRLVLAEDIFARYDIPAFSQSSMDGYAFQFESLKDRQPILLQGESAAGQPTPLILEPGTAARIFTGAP
ncbi:MAG: molybdopterin molybdenumtransferase MoeA, partial [Chitinophagaceae bacterium]|nr:molybdopterin molybdenumtransferase MoeA [Chitinophagaceae bacterium]